MLPMVGVLGAELGGQEMTTVMAPLSLPEDTVWLPPPHPWLPASTMKRRRLAQASRSRSNPTVTVSCWPSSSWGRRGVKMLKYVEQLVPYEPRGSLQT